MPGAAIGVMESSLPHLQAVVTTGTSESRRVRWTSWSLNRVPHRVGLEFVFIFTPAPPSMLPVAAPHVCLLLLPLHVLSPCGPVWGPQVLTLLATASVPGREMLGLQRLAHLALSFHLQQDSSGGDRGS